jgi:hypothetical protein
MSAEKITKVDLIEAETQAAVERARENVLQAAKEIGDRMARLVARIEGEPVDAYPPTAIFSLQNAADFERLMIEWSHAKQTLRTVRLLRRAMEP